jgi:nicotinate-nucleotide pyrophosphorylase (carboxylating)
VIQVPTTVAADVRRALDEDIRTGDVTADLIPADADGQASLLTRDPLVIAGIPYAEEVFRPLDSRVSIDWLVNEGDHIEANTRLGRFTGPARTLLTGERTALNFIQMLSAVASRTRDLAMLV